MDKQAKRGAAYEWGMEAEQIAADYLLARGYVIRERRWRCGASKKEIDIIAEKDAVMVFVEVKAPHAPIPTRLRLWMHVKYGF